MPQLIDIQPITADTVKMAGLVEQSLKDSARSLGDHDVDLAGQVVARDVEIDRLESAIDRQCLDALAGNLRGRALRVVAATYRLIVDLERIGDYSVSISNVTRAVANKPVSVTALEILKMAEIAQHMFTLSMDAYAQKRPTDLEVVFDRDLEIDKLYDTVFYNGLGEIVHEPETATNVIHMIIAARALERIGDHITDIAERVQYIETGRLVERSVPMHVPHLERDLTWE